MMRCAVTEWFAHRAASKGAALAFYTLFSMAPILVLVIAVAGFFYGAEAAQGQLFGQLQGPDGRKGRRRHPAGAGRRAQPRKRPARHHHRHRPAAGRRHHRVRRTEGQPGRNLGRAETDRLDLVGHRAHPPALVRPDPGAGFPADGVAGGQRRAGGAGKLRRRAVEGRHRGARLARLADQLRRHRGAVRRDLQAAAAHQAVVARRHHRRARHRGHVRAGQIRHRPVHRQQRRGRQFRRGRLDHRGAAVGVLLGADLLPRRRVRPPVRAPAGQPARPGRTPETGAGKAARSA